MHIHLPGFTPVRTSTQPVLGADGRSAIIMTIRFEENKPSPTPIPDGIMTASWDCPTADIPASLEKIKEAAKSRLLTGKPLLPMPSGTKFREMNDHERAEFDRLLARRTTGTGYCHSSVPEGAPDAAPAAVIAADDVILDTCFPPLPTCDKHVWDPKTMKCRVCETDFREYLKAKKASR